MQPAILVTGGAGFIGSHIALLLARQGYQIIVIDSYRHRQSFDKPWATIYRADYADSELLAHIFTQHRIMAVMHCAALIEVGESVKDPGAYYDNNVSKTIILLRTMVQHGVRNIIFSSSCAVYGIPETILLSEDHPKKPISPYGQTKYMVETILEDFNNAYGLGYVNLRYFNAAGAWPEEELYEQHQPESHLLPLLIQAALESRPFTIFGNDYPTKDGTPIRDFLHVRDIAHAHCLALAHLLAGNPSDSFNLGTGEGTSIKEMIIIVEQVCHTKLTIQYGPRRPGDPAVLVADPVKAHTILRWQPLYSQLNFIVQSALRAEQTREDLVVLAI